MSTVCHVCGGMGMDLPEGCPRCGLTLHKAVTTKTMQIDIPLDLIPLPYQGKIWEPPEPTASTPLKFREFDASLNKVLKEFLTGKVPFFSLFVSSPPKYGKHDFAYSCMQTALTQSFTVAPLLSTSDWRRLYRVSQMNPLYKMYDMYTWDNLVARDVVFIAVDHSDDRFDVLGLLKDVLDTRARFGKSTFIISDYQLESLVNRWNSNNYAMIHNTDTKRDYARYPVILQRFE